MTLCMAAGTSQDSKNWLLFILVAGCGGQVSWIEDYTKLILSENTERYIFYMCLVHPPSGKYWRVVVKTKLNLVSVFPVVRSACCISHSSLRSCRRGSKRSLHMLGSCRNTAFQVQVVTQWHQYQPHCWCGHFCTVYWSPVHPERIQSHAWHQWWCLWVRRGPRPTGSSGSEQKHRKLNLAHSR